MGEYLDIQSSVIMTIREDTGVGDAIARMKPVITEALPYFAKIFKRLPLGLLVVNNEW